MLAVKIIFYFKTGPVKCVHLNVFSPNWGKEIKNILKYIKEAKGKMV